MINKNAEFIICSTLIVLRQFKALLLVVLI